MEISKTNKDMYEIKDTDLVSVKKMGDIIEVCFIEKRNKSITSIKIDKDHYYDTRTGEVKVCNHIENRSQSKAQISQSLKRLRDYINTNVSKDNISNCKWVTLTYKENMQDSTKLYRDFERFIKRLKYRYKDYHIEYIVAMEPQQRGAWHCHCIFIFDKKVPFIPNATIEKLWGNGFTKTNNLSNIDNIGAYLTAYLGDMEYTEENAKDLFSKGLDRLHIKEVDTIENMKLKKPKKFIKGGRLYYYPPNFNLYRCSRGIKKPKKEYLQYSVFKEKEKVSSLLPTYSTQFSLNESSTNYTNLIRYDYYNINRK